MLNISVWELLALLILLPVFGGILGFVFAGDRMRRAGGGKTPVELREELDDYRAGVTRHFRETADLLDGMTEQYRAVYTHLARGSADLCDDLERGPRLEQLEAVLLAAPTVDAAPGDETAGEPPEVDAAAPTATPEPEQTAETEEARAETAELKETGETRETEEREETDREATAATDDDAPAESEAAVAADEGTTPGISATVRHLDGAAQDAGVADDLEAAATTGDDASEDAPDGSRSAA